LGAKAVTGFLSCLTETEALHEPENHPSFLFHSKPRFSMKQAPSVVRDLKTSLPS